MVFLSVAQHPVQLLFTDTTLLAAQFGLWRYEHESTSNQYGRLEVAAPFQPAQRLMGVHHGASPFFSSVKTIWRGGLSGVAHGLFSHLCEEGDFVQGEVSALGIF